MTPHEKKQIFLFYFGLKKTDDKTKEKITDELKKYHFRNFHNDEGMFDLMASVSLEKDYNASKFAKDLLKKYPTILEIEVRNNADKR